MVRKITVKNNFLTKTFPFSKANFVPKNPPDILAIAIGNANHHKIFPVVIKYKIEAALVARLTVFACAHQQRKF